MTRREGSLSPRERSFVDAWVAGETHSGIARQFGVHKSTVSRTYRRPEVQLALRQARGERYLQRRLRLEALADDAIQVLGSIMHDAEASPADRRASAQAILGFAGHAVRDDSGQPQREVVSETQVIERVALIYGLGGVTGGQQNQQNQQNHIPAVLVSQSETRRTEER